MMDEIDNAAEKIAGILTRSKTGLSPKKKKSKRLEMVEEIFEQIKPATTLYCDECGIPFDEYKHGATTPGICKDCLNTRAMEGKMKKYAEKTGITITQDDQHAILIRFAPRDEFLHRALCEWAERERRTPAAQVLWMLEHFQSETGGGHEVTDETIMDWK